MSWRGWCYTFAAVVNAVEFVCFWDFSFAVIAFLCVVLRFYEIEIVERERTEVSLRGQLREVVGPSRDEAALELLRTDPEEYFRRTRRQLP